VTKEQAPGSVDFFVSYNHADEAWAVWTAWVLEEAGFTTKVQAWDFRPGTNFVLEMHRATPDGKADHCYHFTELPGKSLHQAGVGSSIFA
jgi:TIR domain